MRNSLAPEDSLVGGGTTRICTSEKVDNGAKHVGDPSGDPTSLSKSLSSSELQCEGDAAGGGMAVVCSKTESGADGS